jgi:hypothetical protein
VPSAEAVILEWRAVNTLIWAIIYGRIEIKVGSRVSIVFAMVGRRLGKTIRLMLFRVKSNS